MILDEKKIAEDILISKKTATKSDLMVISKYLRNEIKCDVPETMKILSSIMAKINKNFNFVKSAKYLEKVAIRAENMPLRKIENICITKKELATIQSIGNSKLQRLMFTLLVYAKFNNKLSEVNNNWCNITINELYKRANVSVRNAQEKALLLNKLSKTELISFSAHNTNLNIHCNMLDGDSDDIGICIDDLRELGYQYINLEYPNDFIYCENCGVIMKKRNKKDYSTKLCNECFKELKNENNLNWFHQLDKADRP